MRIMAVYFWSANPVENDRMCTFIVLLGSRCEGDNGTTHGNRVISCHTGKIESIDGRTKENFVQLLALGKWTREQKEHASLVILGCGVQGRAHLDVFSQLFTWNKVGDVVSIANASSLV